MSVAVRSRGSHVRRRVVLGSDCHSALQALRKGARRTSTSIVPEDEPVQHDIAFEQTSKVTIDAARHGICGSDLLVDGWIHCTTNRLETPRSETFASP